MYLQIAGSLKQTVRAHGLSPRRLDAHVHAMVKTLNSPGGTWDIGVLLTTDEHIRQLNKRYRKKDKPTDILSFPFHKITVPGRLPPVRSSEQRYLGDMFISLPYVVRQCDELQISLDERMPILFAHGICHLLGYDHERDDDYEQMVKAEEFILSNYHHHMSSF